jgi:uncharacterized membrane protein
MKTIDLIFLHWNYLGTEHEWYWHLPFFFFIMILLMIFLIRRRRRPYYSCGWPGWFGYRYYDKADAKDILKRRYAKGEINKEEYNKMMSEIS